MDETTIEMMDHCGLTFASSGSAGLRVSFSTVQSKAVQRAGRRKPRKMISSKNGAAVTPKMKSSQAAPGVRKILSMGVLSGPGMSQPLSRAQTKQANAAQKSRQRMRRAVAPFQ